jgi:hypothetical protein
MKSASSGVRWQGSFGALRHRYGVTDADQTGHTISGIGDREVTGYEMARLAAKFVDVRERLSGKCWARNRLRRKF